MYSYHYVLLKMFWCDVGLSQGTTTKKHTSRVYLKCLDELQEGVLHSKTKEIVHIDICPQTVFEIQSNNELISPVVFCLWGHLKPLIYSSTTENEDTLTNTFFMPVKPFAAAVGPLKGCYLPLSDMSMCTLIHVEDI